MQSQIKARSLSFGGLVAFNSGTRLDVKSGASLPSRINVGPWGQHETSKGRITINETTARELPSNQRCANFDRVALDFNHNTVPGSESYRGEPALIAANATPGIVPGEGIIFDQVEWTPEGRAHVTNGHYIDLSPTLQLNSGGEAVFIHSAALCRNGAIPNLSLFAADPLGEAALKEPDFKKLLCSVLGVPENASEVQIEGAALVLAEHLDLLVNRGDLDENFARGVRCLNAKFLQSSAEEAIRIKFGISKEKWQQINGAAEQSVTLSATSPTDASEIIRVRMGISKEAWDRAT